MAISWSDVSEDSDGFLLLSVVLGAPVALFLISPSLCVLPYFIVPAALLVKREPVVELGDLRERESRKQQTAQVAITANVSKVRRPPRTTMGPLQAWVCLECWFVFAKRPLTIPDCPCCEMPYSAMKLQAREVDLAKELRLAGASHVWCKLKFPELWPKDGMGLPFAEP